MFFMVMLVNDSDVLVETEDGTCQQERLRHVIEQAVGHVVNHDDLISNQRNAAHDEQHRTGILRDFKARVFHSIRFGLHQGLCTGTAKQSCADGGNNFQDDSYCFVHSVVCV